MIEKFKEGTPTTHNKAVKFIHKKLRARGIKITEEQIDKIIKSFFETSKRHFIRYNELYIKGFGRFMSSYFSLRLATETRKQRISLSKSRWKLKTIIEKGEEKLYGTIYDKL